MCSYRLLIAKSLGSVDAGILRAFRIAIGSSSSLDNAMSVAPEMLFVIMGE